MSIATAENENQNPTASTAQGSIASTTTSAQTRMSQGDNERRSMRASAPVSSM